MKLLDLEPKLLRRELRRCERGPSDECSVVHADPVEHEVWVNVDTIAQADGLIFLCPKCFRDNGGAVGTHAVVCWRPRVPADVEPKPGRWEILGSGLGDLSLVAGSSSVLLTDGCRAHFFVRDGAIVDA